jgi:hypothetical protein
LRHFYYVAFRLAKGDLFDKHFEGLGMIEDQLKQVEDLHALLRYLDWIIRENPDTAVKVGFRSNILRQDPCPIMCLDFIGKSSR